MMVNVSCEQNSFSCMSFPVNLSVVGNSEHTHRSVGKHREKHNFFFFFCEIIITVMLLNALEYFWRIIIYCKLQKHFFKL